MISRTPATRRCAIHSSSPLPLRIHADANVPIFRFADSSALALYPKPGERERERERDGTRKGKKEDPKEGQERRRQGCGSIDEGDFRIIRERKATPTD